MQHLQKTTGEGVEIMVNQVLGTSQPSFFLLPCSVPRCLVAGQSSVFRTLFQVRYSAAPLFATLTKTPGVWGYSSHFGTSPAPSVPPLIRVLSSSLLPPLRRRKRARNDRAHPRRHQNPRPDLRRTERRRPPPHRLGRSSRSSGGIRLRGAPPATSTT